MKALLEHVEAYLGMRRALGFKLRDHGHLLPDFVGYLDAVGVPSITSDAAVAWATRSQDVQPTRWRARLTVVRGFARYLHALDPNVQVPPTDLLPCVRQRPTPYPYSSADIAALLSAAGAMRQPLRAATHRTLIGLLAATGMRVSEVLALDDHDVDLDDGLLVVHQTKFNKSRRLPLHATTTDALRGYVREREQLLAGAEGAAFFRCRTGARLVDRRVRATFASLVEQIGLQPQCGSSPARLHGLRHHFAVATLLDWYRCGTDVAASMPLLSAYLGHSNPASTYWYLQATPELLELAANRLEHRAEAIA